VLHIALHGTPDGIYFQHGDSHQLIPYSSLLDDIKQTSNLLLVVLNVCYSAYSAENVKSPSFARSLVDMGIPAVVGMATQFTPRASVEFSKRLYAELSNGHPAIQGFDRAIDTLRNHPKYDSLLWSVPMYYHNVNVIPFPTVWENNARLKQKPKIDIELIRKMRKLSQEGNVVLQDLHPYSEWGLEQWDIETIPLRFLLQQLKSGISALENMSTTHDTETMGWIFSIRDKAHETSSLLYEIELNLDKVLDDTLSQRERRNISEEFDQNRLVLIQYLNDLSEILR
ncbi:MAG TPA: CHAT domain-containing protein, partial [Anaerolineales bacterium]|nr:CHAT domain-containing protein [Anaerolineales bacterium]